VVQLTATRRGVIVGDDDLDAAREQFARHHVLRLPHFLDDDLLARVRDGIAHGTFTPREDKDIAVELCLEPGRALHLLTFVMNAPPLFDAVRRITGCASIGCFTGRIYRFDPRVAHHDSWHDDMAAGGRLIGFSLNLGEPYRGGLFQLREKANHDAITEIANTNPGDAFLFRIDERLQHRVTSVEGDAPKTAFAGWFIEGVFDLHKLLGDSPS